MTTKIDPTPRSPRTPFVFLSIGFLLLLVGSYFGLFVAPPEQFMGQVQRIMYVHVPTAWSAMLAMCWVFICAVMYLFGADWKWDSRLEAALEVAAILSFLLCCQGSIWAKPTWGVWWDWDPRLTTIAILLIAYLGVISLRHFVEDPVRRAVWSAVAAIVSSVDVPIVYWSVKWWNSLHQPQSSPHTVSSAFYIPLRVNAFGVLFLMIGFMILRTRIARYRLAEQLEVPPTAQAAVMAGEAL